MPRSVKMATDTTTSAQCEESTVNLSPVCNTRGSLGLSEPHDWCRGTFAGGTEESQPASPSLPFMRYFETVSWPAPK